MEVLERVLWDADQLNHLFFSLIIYMKNLYPITVNVKV